MIFLNIVLHSIVSHAVGIGLDELFKKILDKQVFSIRNVNAVV